MTVTYVYCFSLLELSKSNKLIWYHSICWWIHFSQKHIFFTIFKRNDPIFSQFSKEMTRFFHNWSGTGPLHNFGKKTLTICSHGSCISLQTVNRRCIFTTNIKQKFTAVVFPSRSLRPPAWWTMPSTWISQPRTRSSTSTSVVCSG